MAEFEEFIGKERAELSRRRDELVGRQKDLDRQLQDIEREIAAIEAYEQAKKGGGTAPGGTGSRRRTGVRQNVLDLVERYPDGIKRADIIEEMNVKGDKRAEQSVSNALGNLKKRGHVRLEKGAYTAA